MLPDPLLQDDHEARVRALDITRSFVVQAPAGSGKTELLIQRYLTLLATVDAPEEILAITFTVKAANEMQQRVIAALQHAAHGEVPVEMHYRVTFDAAMKVLERDRQLGWQLTESPRRMRIQTLDAFNASIARSLPFSSGLGGAVHVASDEDMQAIYRDAAAATLEWLLAEDDMNAAVEQTLAHLDNNTATYLEHVAKMLETRDQWLPITGAGREPEGQDDPVRILLERNVASRIAAHLQRVQRLLPPGSDEALLRLGRYAASQARCSNDGPRQSALDAVESLSPAADHLIAWCEIADLLLTRSGEWRKTVNVSNGFPPADRGEKQEMLGLLAALASHSELCRDLHKVRALPHPRYTDAQWAVLRALFRLLPLAVTELRRLFSQRGVTDYTEVAMAAGAALGDPDDPSDIALLLDYSLRHLLIDEMQDTSIAQYRLVEKLVAGWEPGDGRTLFCVGDPMQSIYRFRDAEVGRFLLARDQGIGGVKLESLVLRRNFRSGEHLVGWFNRVFEEAFPADDDIAAGAISYAASAPAALHGDAGLCRVHPLFGAGAGADDEAARAVAIVRQCLQAPAEQNTALLVRSRTRLPELLAELRAAGIDYQAVEIDRMTDLPEIIDMLALTRALCHRADRIAWLGLLRGPWVGLTWSDLHQLVVNDRHASVWELLHDGRRIAALSPRGVARIRSFGHRIEPFLRGHGAAALRETVERAWFALAGPLARGSAEEVENVYRFLDVLERMETAGTLPDAAELEATLDRERVSSRSDHDGRLQIMTIHKAKGLQFDHVVLYGLGRRPRGDRPSVMRWLHLPDSSGHEELLLSPVGAHADLEADRLHRYIAATEREKERLEQVRLLYVACTRARRSLHLLGHVSLHGERDEFGEPAVDSLLYGIWPAVRSIYRDAFEASRRTSALQRLRPGRTFREPELHRLPDPVSLPAAPPLPGISRAQSPGPEFQPVHYDWVGPVARQAGTIVHRWLKRMTDTDLDAIGTRTSLLAVSRTWARELGVPAADLDAVCARVEQSLARIREDERGRWLLSGAGHSELPLTGLWNGRLESIVIDRVRIDDDGVHWIVDYKTSTHEGADLAGFLLQEAERYRLQLGKYAQLYREFAPVAVRTALYFPLLQEFREVMTDL